MTSRLRQLQKRCTELKAAGLHNDPCNGKGVDLAKLQALIDRLQPLINLTDDKTLSSTNQTFRDGNNVPSSSSGTSSTTIVRRKRAAKDDPTKIDIQTSNQPEEIMFPEDDEPLVREWSDRSNKSTESPLSTNNVIEDDYNDEGKCRDRISLYDSRFFAWLEALQFAREEYQQKIPVSWCGIYRELVKVGNNAMDESILYTIADDDIDDLMMLIDTEVDGDNFADRYPVLMTLFVDAGFIAAKGYLLAHEEANFVDLKDIESLLSYITTTRMAHELYNRYKQIAPDNRKYPTAVVLEKAIRSTESHLAKRGMLLFLAQFDSMVSKNHFNVVLQTLYDYVVNNDAFIEQILSLSNLKDFDALATIGAKRNSPKALARILEYPGGLDQRNKSYLLVIAVASGFIHNVDVLLQDKRVDPTNDGEYTAFREAARRGSAEIFGMLFPKYPPYKERPKLPIIPALRIAAIEGGNWYIVGRSLMFPSEDDDEALSKAVETLNIQIITLILNAPDTIISWASDAISQLVERDVDDDLKVEILTILLRTKGMPIPINDENVINFIATHGVPLLREFFDKRRFPPPIILALRTAADNVDAYEEYDFIIKNTTNPPVK